MTALLIFSIFLKMKKFEILRFHNLPIFPGLMATVRLKSLRYLKANSFLQCITLEFSSADSNPRNLKFFNISMFFLSSVRPDQTKRCYGCGSNRTRKNIEILKNFRFGSIFQENSRVSLYSHPSSQKRHVNQTASKFLTCLSSQMCSS